MNQEPKSDGKDQSQFRNGARTPRPREPVGPNQRTDPPALIESAPGKDRHELVSEMLILPDGRMLVHSLTPAMASILNELNPEDDSIQPRAERQPP